MKSLLVLLVMTIVLSVSPAFAGVRRHGHVQKGHVQKGPVQNDNVQKGPVQKAEKARTKVFHRCRGGVCR